MNINAYKQVVLDQKKEKDEIDLTRLASRREEAYFDWNSPLAQIVIGVRRSGKSTICHKALQQNHINYGYINFDDERLYDLKAENLNTVLEALYMVYGDFQYLFFDEIQNVETWFLFVNRLLRQKIRLLITGSNAKLLSAELSTHLTGRYHQIELFPFSFSEFLKYKNIRSDDDSTRGVAFKKRAFEEYLSQGGFPELFEVKNKKAYIKNLFHSIIARDIRCRFSVRYPEALRKMADYLTDTIATEINYRRLAEQFSFGSSHTAENYVGFLRQAYLLVGIQKFSFKSKERVRNEKNYAIDPAFISAAKEGFSEKNLGWRLENIVCIELLRRRNQTLNDVYYYRNGYEIDFVLCSDNQVVELIQVSADMSSEKTFNRETNALFRAASELKCDRLTIVTLNEDGEYADAGRKIKIISIQNWLNSIE
ncbi:MAG: ATP-binding protein [Planctomycetaceae bacterium]|jgi:predicted AAA+ superfamily ATPase|nr:ATP-binding protein [Planctomycetaceae bacterium]